MKIYNKICLRYTQSNSISSGSKNNLAEDNQWTENLFDREHLIFLKFKIKIILRNAV